MTTIKTVTASFTRPNDTTAYAVGDLVADTTTAGSVTPMKFVIPDTGRGILIRRAWLRKSGTGITSALFRLHLYRTSSIVCANGDNGAWSTDSVAFYADACDITVDRAFTDGAAGFGLPLSGSEINVQQNTLIGVLEARGAYNPAALEVFTLGLECLFD